MNALELKNVQKHYKGFDLDVSLTLPEGCIMGFIGENGAGKTTTIKAMLGLVKSEGELNVLGRPKEALNEVEEELGVVLDECGFCETLNAKDVNLIMKNIFKTWSTERFNGYMEKFSIDVKKHIKDYSKGMKTKLSIACALSHDSRLLILDEATSGLDPVVRDEVLEILMDYIQDERRAVFISSHITSDLEKVCDYITFIHNGRIVMSSAKDELLETYCVVKCSESELETLPKSALTGVRYNRFGAEALAKRAQLPAGVTADPATIEDIMLYTIREDENA